MMRMGGGRKGIEIEIGIVNGTETGISTTADGTKTIIGQGTSITPRRRGMMMSTVPGQEGVIETETGITRGTETDIARGIEIEIEKGRRRIKASSPNPNQAILHL